MSVSDGSLSDTKSITIHVTDVPALPQTGNLTVFVTLINDNGGTKTLGDFGFNVTENYPAPIYFLGFETGTVLTLQEGRYTMGIDNIIGTGFSYNVSFSSACSFSMSAGANYVCNIVLNDNPTVTPITDICPNVTGIQTEGPCEDALCLTPNVWNTEAQHCDVSTPPADVCPNIEGTQEILPPGKHIDGKGDCVNNSRGGSRGGSTGSSISKGQVLGAETEICNWGVDTYMRLGYEKNNMAQVLILQRDLLNGVMHAGLKEDGIYGPKTAAAVKKFQELHSDTVLKPWNLNQGTSIFYQTTLIEAKNTMCPAVKLPIPNNLTPWTN